MGESVVTLGPPDLIAWRKRTGLTQPEAARAFGAPLVTYRSWERGRRRPSGVSLHALARGILPKAKQPRVGQNTVVAWSR